MRRHPRTTLILCGGLFLGSLLQVPAFAEPVQLNDEELDQVHAEGLLIHMDMNLDVASGIPALSGGPVFLQTSDVPTSIFNNAISISGNALQNTQNLFNVVATGDVAVGINLFVFIGDVVNSTLNNTGSNLNFADLSAAFTSSQNNH